MTSEKILCVVLNWNGGDQIVDCIRSLQANRSVRIAVLVVDNGSHDGSLAEIREHLRDVRIVANSRNTGVAHGFNQGLTFAQEEGYRQILFLNSDTVFGPRCLHELQSALDSRPRVGIVSPRIRDGEHGGIWFDGGRVNWFGDPVHRRSRGDAPEPLTLREEDCATACAMLAARSLFEEIGRFDEHYFAYSEDADLCLRAKSRGWHILHVPAAEVVHFPSSSVRLNRGKWFRDYYVTRNKLRLARKHLALHRFVLFWPYFVVAHLLPHLGYFLITGQVSRLKAVVLGAADFLRGRSGERYS